MWEILFTKFSSMFGLQGSETTGITADIQNYLASIQENQELISWDYVLNIKNENFKEMIKNLYPGEDDRFKILNVGTYIAGLIDDKIRSYVGAPEDGLDYRIDYDKLLETLLTTGYLMLKLYSTEAKGWQVQAIDGSKYYSDGVTEYFLDQYKIEEKDPVNGSLMETKFYLYVQTFSGHVLKNKLFEIQQGVLSIGKPVKLEIIPELAGRPDEQIIMETDKLVYSQKVEYSLIKKVKSLIYSIERKWMEADKQFQNYMEQFMVFDNIEIPVTAKKEATQDGHNYKVTDFKKLGKIVESDAEIGSGNIKIIKNGNDLIKDALEFSERQLRQISAITDIPTIFLGLDSQQGNDSGTSIVKSSGGFYKRVERYRTGIENLFWDLGEVFSDFKGMKFTWKSIVTSDPTEVIDSEIKKLEAGLTSKKRAIMKIDGVSEEEAQKLMDEMALEMASVAPVVAPVV